MNSNTDPQSFRCGAQHHVASALYALLVFWGSSQGWCTPGTVLTWGGGQVPPATPLTSISAVSVALDHSLALRADGTVSAWGYNFDGQCQVPSGLNQTVAIAAGAFFSVALRSDRTVVVWGDNQFNQTQVPMDATGVVAISAGRGHVLALKSDGTLVAWGSDIFGQADVPQGLGRVVSVFANWNYSLALLANGTVAAWGINDAGQTDVPAGLANVVAVTGNMEYCLALKSDGTVVAWGKAPSVPQGLSGITAVAAGENHCLALTSAGTIVGWGSDTSGQTEVPSSAGRAISLGAGWNYSVALISGSVVTVPFSLTGANWTAGVFSATVPTQANQTYILQYKSTANDPTWTGLAPVQGTGQSVRLTDSTATNLHRIYRVNQL